MPSSPASPDTSTTGHVVSVAVPVPGLGLLSYRIADGVAPPPKGARVSVPLGTRSVVGVVVAPLGPVPGGAALKDIHEAIDDEPFLPESIVDLALWVGEYYACGPGDALAVAMPPAARDGTASAFRTVRVAEAVDVPDDQALRTGRQREGLERLRGRPGGVRVSALQAAGIGPATLKTLERRGLIRFREEVVERDPFRGAGDGAAVWTIGGGTDVDRALTSEQVEALATLQEAADARQFRTILLHGVTGSGKTELYLRLAAHVISTGRRVLVMVPEIALTPAVAGHFRACFGARVAVQHSGLSDGERHDQWHRIRRGDVDVVVGTRSAVFAPIDRLGLLIVDEEHESAYKQEEAPRYHGRDVAVMRARMMGALVVLGTATPSLESAANAASGRYHLVRLTRRVLDRPLADVTVVDMRREFSERGPDVILSRTLAEAIERRLERREQTLVLLNRRGFASVVFCRQCAASVECPHCSVTLTFHRAARRLRCHYCNYAAAVPSRCGACGGDYLEQSGYGTERVEAELRRDFPSARIARVDRDTVRRRGAIARVLSAVASGEIDILVGTQMIAKGHDFPAVTLVGVISADIGLGLADFRAAERTFQLLTQVVGRAGRGAVRGEAVIQTLYPEHYSVRAAAGQDYQAFFDREMEFRNGMQYPPSTGLINVVVKGKSIDDAMADARTLGEQVRAAGSRIIGPAPAALSKIKDEYRAQFFIKGKARKPMREALLAALERRPDLRRRIVVDVDPMSVT